MHIVSPRKKLVLFAQSSIHSKQKVNTNLGKRRLHLERQQWRREEHVEQVKEANARRRVDHVIGQELIQFWVEVGILKVVL